jgi:hypothetical protein
MFRHYLSKAVNWRINSHVMWSRGLDKPVERSYLNRFLTAVQKTEMFHNEHSSTGNTTSWRTSYATPIVHRLIADPAGKGKLWEQGPTEAERYYKC